MKIGLFIPCYVNQFYPNVAIATLHLLESLGVTAEYPLNQTCCGQPMANSGYGYLTDRCNTLFFKNFNSYDYIVSPSGSCVLHIKEHLHVNGFEDESHNLSKRVFELTEFLVDVLKADGIKSSFPFKVGLHQSCHGQRGLKLSQMSELVASPFSKTEFLLKEVKGLELIKLSRKDECCGFGGTFCVTEEAVSVKMGKDRVQDHIGHGAQYITGNDVSCLMHLEGILKRNKSRVKIIHIAEILTSEK
ncbi:L-lactate dehydrogenase complex protein LldE [Chryseolinea serpens]|uniref:L-lactate dehydrogenase complex protein LldE n=1 Tax=Chryseolinea serpens TaxID=947013 RepID=A0A1M5TC42_9BACT|nr:(Fe-S)-binding protein [Chryseolinea serpens]SHH48256.1 L-lactate dehydrogenase complex protein LldE [Chryseolinea serpens]